MEALVRNAWLVPFFPLLGACVAAIGGRWLKQRSHLPVVLGIGLAFLVSLGLLGGTGVDAASAPIEWLTITGLSIPIEFQADGLTTMMLAMVTFVSTLVAIFSAGYMAGDPGYPRFFALVGLFVFSMTGLVLSSNFLLTYVFWEGVGFCSYMLVGFWYNKPAAAEAAKKAFLVNRVGDVGFAIAIFWMWTVTRGHDLSYSSVFDPDNLAAIDRSALIGIPLLLFWAATAKSAQIPLYVWLPDAMEGPTPVSALIHAATMVTAGVYLLARSTPMLVLVPGVQLAVSTIGCLTALLAASIALTQTDLKRVLAYSTVSQLGYMFMALGAGIGGLAGFAVIAAMFHLFTHAFFKALLFLSAGSVMHATGGVIDMREFGGLRRRLPITCLAFAAGGLALSGIFPFAGFFSKDEVLASLKDAAEASNASGGSGWGWAYYAIYGLAIITAFLTALYTARAFLLTFYGPEKLPDPSAHEGHADAQDAEPGHATDHFGHESPPVMTIPLMILAVCALVVGALFWETGWFEHHLELTRGLEPVEGVAPHGTDWFTAIVGLLAGLAGLALGFVLYGRPSPVPARLAGQLRPLYLASLHKFGVDELYRRAIVWPTNFLGVMADFLDKFVVDGLVQAVAWLPRFLGRGVLGRSQSGLIQHYLGVTALSVGVLLLYLMFAV